MLRLCGRLADVDRVFREGHSLKAEFKYAGVLKEAMDDGDKELEVAALKSLGDVYLHKGATGRNGNDFTKASALYNSALVCCQDPDNSQSLLHRIKRTEKVFLEKVGGINEVMPSTLQTDHAHKSQLQKIRSESETALEEIKKQCSYEQGDRESEETLSAERDRAVAVRRLYQNTASKIKQFISDLLRECFSVLGDPPCLHAVIGLGSLAREEMTPFSDFEFAILIDEGGRSEENVRYFRIVTYLLHLKILNLQETILPAMVIKSLNNFEGDPAGNWFYDSVMPQGLAFDGAMPWASKTPLGRGPYKNKPALELIRTPREMADLLRENEDHLGDVLRKVCLIAGDQRLMKEYEGLVNEYLDSPSSIDGLAVRTERALYTLCSDMETFNIHRIPRRGEPFNVKKFVYRLTSLVVDSLGLLVGSDEKTAAAILSEMAEHTIMHRVNCHHVQVAAAIADETRMRTYLANGGQKELASFYPTCPVDDYAGAPIFRDIEPRAMHRFFKTTFALQFFLTSAIDEQRFKEFETIHRPGSMNLTQERALTIVSNLFNKLRKSEVYVDTPSIQAVIHSVLQENVEAENCYRIALAQPNDTMSKCRIALDFANTLLINGKRSGAIGALKNIASTFEVYLKTTKASDAMSAREVMFRAWRKLIEVNSTMGDVAAVNDVVTAYNELSLLPALRDVSDNYSVDLLCEIAQHYNRVGKHNLGHKYLCLAKADVDKIKALSEGRVSSRLARSVFTVGFTALQLEEQTTSTQYLKESLEAYSRLYGSDSQATEVTAAKLALVRAYREQAAADKSRSILKKLFNWFKATPYFTDIEWWWKVLDPKDEDVSSLAESLEEMKLEIQEGSSRVDAVALARFICMYVRLLEERHRYDELDVFLVETLPKLETCQCTSQVDTLECLCRKAEPYIVAAEVLQRRQRPLQTVEHLRLAFCHLKSCKHTDANRWSDHIGLLYRLSILQRDIGDEKSALNTAFLGLGQLKERSERTLIEPGRGDASLLSLVGEVFAGVNEIQEAINVWEVELQIRTSLKESGVQLGLVHYELGFCYQVVDTKKAIEHLEKGLDVLKKIPLSSSTSEGHHVRSIDNRGEAKARVHVPDLIVRSNELLNKLRSQAVAESGNVLV